MANSVQELLDIPVPEGIKGAYFLRLALNADVPNIYWLTTEPKDYTSLSQLPKSRPGIKTEIKKANVAIESNAADKAEAVKVAVKRIDQAAAKGILHKNTAARKKSALDKKLNAGA